MSKDDLKGSKYFELRTGDFKIPFDIELTICSTATLFDGFFPYSSTIDSINTILTQDSDGTTVTGIINGTPSLNGNNIELDLDYPDALGAGVYTLWANIDFTTGAVARRKTLKAARIKIY